jgi:HEAT repeat protein
MLRDPRGVDAIIDALEKGEIGTRAKDAVSDLSWLQHVELDAKDTAIDALVRILGDAREKNRDAAAWGLGAIGDKRSISALIESMKQSDLYVTLSVRGALSMIGESAVDPLLSALDDNELRNQSARTLKHIRPLRAIVPLINSLRFTSSLEHSEIPRVLSHYGETAVDPLIDALSDQSPSLRVNAIVALGLISDPAAIPALIDKLEDTSSSVRLEAAKAMSRFPDTRAIDNLLTLCRDTDERIRLAASAALAKIPDNRATEYFVTLLQDDDPKIVVNALEALSSVRHISAIDAVISCMKNPHADVRSAAADTIGVLGAPEGYEILSTKIVDEDEERSVRVSCANAMKEIGTKDKVVQSLMESILKSSNEYL